MSYDNHATSWCSVVVGLTAHKVDHLTHLCAHYFAKPCCLWVARQWDCFRSRFLKERKKTDENEKMAYFKKDLQSPPSLHLYEICFPKNFCLAKVGEKKNFKDTLVQTIWPIVFEWTCNYYITFIVNIF